MRSAVFENKRDLFLLSRAQLTKRGEFWVDSWGTGGLHGAPIGSRESVLGRIKEARDGMGPAVKAGFCHKWYFDATTALGVNQTLFLRTELAGTTGTI
eukprot:jgi/Botrbrau1/10179/Bobra.0121s0022.1